MVLDWVKLADDGSGDLILRVYEAVGGEAHARLAVNAALGKATVRECSIMEDARLDAELPAAFADGDPSVARTAQEPASVPIGHVARQLWKRWWKY